MATTRNKKAADQITPHSLRETLRDRGVADSLTEFAGKISRSRQAIYFALEKPDRYPLVWREIIKAIA